MWNKIKRLKYQIFILYFLIGIIVSVLVFQFITHSLSSQSLQFSSLFARETGILLVSCLVGALVGGLIYLIPALFDKKSKVREHEFWLKIKNAKISSLILRNILAFSLAGFVGLLIQNILQTDLYTDFFHSLFSYESIIDYIGIILASSLFAIILTFGIVKRLKQLYGNGDL